MKKKVLILGASGKIGTHAARAFNAANWEVRKFDRNKDDMSEAARGADVIINGLNPPNYHNWEQLIPEITQQVIKAAKQSGATVIVPGNVYNFGSSEGEWDENTTQRPSSRKGQIRIEMEEAYKRSGVQTIVLRAGNFIDPDRNGDIFSLVIMKDPTAKRIAFPAHPATMQAYCWLPDWAVAAVQLAEMRSKLMPFEDIPLGGLDFSAVELAETIKRLTGRAPKIGGFPWFLIRATAPFWELARELKDMRYLWGTNHQLGKKKLERLLPGFRVTPLEMVLVELLDLKVDPDHSVPTPHRIAVS